MSNILPVITLYQPWATWIMRGWKTIETRTHNRFACLNEKMILIHAGLTTDNSELATKNPYLTHKQIIHKPEEMVNGYILGSVFVSNTTELTGLSSKAALIDCLKTTRYGLFLRNINEFKKPIPVKGNMGIWYYDLEKQEKVNKPTAQVVLF